MPFQDRNGTWTQLDSAVIASFCAVFINATDARVGHTQYSVFAIVRELIR
jgi:hypothetical protein